MQGKLVISSSRRSDGSGVLMTLILSTVCGSTTVVSPAWPITVASPTWLTTVAGAIDWTALSTGCAGFGAVDLGVARDRTGWLGRLTVWPDVLWTGGGRTFCSLFRVI